MSSFDTNRAHLYRSVTESMYMKEGIVFKVGLKGMMIRKAGN
jgi:hypothetical protein